MRSGLRVLVPALMISATLMLSGCKSSEEKAEDYYQSGLTLLAAGDEDRALVEFRNVFKYNGFHKEARQTYADLQLKRGELTEAYSQYLRLIEQYPDTADVRRTLAEIAITHNDWDEAERHGKAAIALTPDDPAVKSIAAALDYRTAMLGKDTTAATAAVVLAQEVLRTRPEDQVARRIVIDHLANGPTPQDALPEVDKALAIEPKSLEFNALKFRLLAMKQDMAGTGAQLKTMFELYPDNLEIRSALIGWYLSQKDIDGAEAFCANWRVTIPQPPKAIWPWYNFCKPPAARMLPRPNWTGWPRPMRASPTPISIARAKLPSFLKKANRTKLSRPSRTF